MYLCVERGFLANEDNRLDYLINVFGLSGKEAGKLLKGA